MTGSGWFSDIREWLARHDASGAFVLCFPAYRPDLVRELAARLEFSHVDFREERLAPLGWNAARLPLSSLGEAVDEAMERGRGVVLQNSEALLSAHPEALRRAWLKEAINRPWPRPLLLPIVLFQHDLPPDTDRIHTIGAADLPPESLLLRLSTLQ